MKKRILFLVLALTLLCALCVGTTVTAFAEEVPATETEITEDINVEELTPEEVKQMLADLLAKVNSLTGEDNFFKNKILPWLIATITDLGVVGAILIGPFIKNKSKAAKMEAYAQTLQQEKNNLLTLLSSTDSVALKKAITELFGDYIEKAMTEFKKEFSSNLKVFASIKATIETEYAQIKALIEAARQAWASKPEVVALLAEAPEKSTLEEQAAQIERMKSYIREVKGEEAEKIISDLGVV
ncbi:MAG: hypothetical protein II988_06605 [Clostridia bacterium]|nr:hypothetical protein [Clostridia bacterium]MBQ3597460.1 hypothetical protein [Clostridia bacterium]